MTRPSSESVTLARIANEHARLSLLSSGEQAIHYRRAARAYRRASKSASMRDLSRATVVSSTPVPGGTYEGDF